MQKLPLQPPYYDMAPSESTPFTDKPVSTDAVSGVTWASLWRGHPQLLPLVSSNCCWKGEYLVRFCLVVLQTWFTMNGASLQSLRSFHFCLSGVMSRCWPVNPLGGLTKLLISSSKSAPLILYVNLASRHPLSFSLCGRFHVLTPTACPLPHLPYSSSNPS